MSFRLRRSGLSNKPKYDNVRFHSVFKIVSLLSIGELGANCLGFYPLTKNSVKALSNKIYFEADDNSAAGNQMKLSNFGTYF